MTDDDATTGGSQAAGEISVGRPRMPLGARRLVLIGGLGALAGVLAGRYYFAGLILAAAGITLLALALSYRTGTPWFSRLSWLVLAAGALWTASTAGYWWLIDAAANGAARPPGNTSLLFYLGIGSLVIMLATVLAAVILRGTRALKPSVPDVT
ncbi:hypothetical protein [Arthrobacter sp. PAMC25284]|uniref:hypothetical protein n=1 Tax=Arthrobacter sp. PAMC25284 TaxID=2861279 RepID=UPI001C631037|nr:hypothetical protein [Arthrobacter sp. PAMC25284]QYF90482.1 hypothetical protein KY499_04015 [Arthrobacter sp. PAMC25284]